MQAKVKWLLFRTLALCAMVPTALSQQIPTAAIQQPLRVDDALSALSMLEPPSLSPDGRLLAYTLRDPRRQNFDPASERWFTNRGTPIGKVGCDIWVTDVKSGDSKNLTEGKDNNWAPVWSLNGKYLAFYSDRGGKANVWIYDREAGNFRQVADAVVRPYRSSVLWTADSRKVLTKVLPEGVSIDEAEEALLAPQQHTRQEQRVPGSTVTVYRSSVATKNGVAPGSESSDIQQDLATRALHADLGLIDIATGRIERIARGFNPAWYGISTDGSSFAFTHLKGQAGGNNWRNLFDLVLVPSHGNARVIASDIRQEGHYLAVSWSPDSKWLSYTTSGEGTNGEIYFVPVGGGPPRKPTQTTHRPLSDDYPGRAPIWDVAGKNLFLIVSSSAVWKVSLDQGSATEIARMADRRIIQILVCREESRFWSPDAGRSMVVRTLDKKTMRSGFYRVDLARGAFIKLLEEDKMYGPEPDNTIVSGDGQSVIYVAQDAEHDRDFWAADANFQAPRRITNINARFNRYRMGKSRLIDWMSLHGQTLRGALLLPSGYQEGQRCPLIVWVYGGADLSSQLNEFGFSLGLSHVDNMQLLATRGYAVLLPDSPLGAGTPMTDLAKTILPGVNKLVELGIADRDRIGVMGGSMGGYSTLSLVVQTTRFKAAVMWAGMGNLVGFHGEMRKDGSAYAIGPIEGYLKIRGGPWESPQRYIENSPVFHLDRVQTPLLIVHGSADETVAPFLADEIFVGLRRLGKEVVYAKYEGERHGIAGYANQLDYCNRVIEWFDRYLKGKKTNASQTAETTAPR